MAKTKSNIKGIGYLLLAMLIISVQNIAIKWIGGDYSALEIVAIRSLIALPCTLLFYRSEGQKGLPKTKHLKLESLRGLFLFLSYTSYMMGLASLPLAEIEAIRFSGPLIITILSVILLREKVEPMRWLVLAVGFVGVLLVVRPGSATFNLGSIFIIISVIFYGLTVVATRKLQEHDSSATMAFYSSIIYLLASLVLVPIPYLVSNTANAHPSIAFLLREWSLPSLMDLVIMAGLGLIWAAWIFFMSKAYSEAKASDIAPLEYMSMPISIVWGFLIWQEVPTLLTLAGAALTLLSGLYIWYRDRKQTE
jgi:drug/metabolite transporter (DMT)-like permease